MRLLPFDDKKHTHPRGWNALTEPEKAEARAVVRLRTTTLGAAARQTGAMQMADIFISSCVRL